MTRKQRLVSGLKNSSLLGGLRLEPLLVKALVHKAKAELARAQVHARETGQLPPDPRADVAATVRVLLRVQLGQTPRQAVEAEVGPFDGPAFCGLRVDPKLAQAIRDRRADLGLNAAATVRHLLRLAVGMNAKESLAVEARFAQIAVAKKKLGMGLK